MKFLFTFLFSFTFILGMSQISRVQFQEQVIFLGKAYHKDEIKSDPYVFGKDFRPAKIAEDYEIIKARYNGYTDEIEFIQNQKVYILPKETKFSYIKFLDSSPPYVLITKDDSTSGYLVELYNSDSYQLYRKDIVKFYPPKEEVGYQKGSPAEYKPSPSIYYLSKSNKMVEFPSNKRKIAEVFSSDGNKVSHIIKKHNLRFKDENDYLILLTELDQLNQ